MNDPHTVRLTMFKFALIFCLAFTVMLASLPISHAQEPIIIDHSSTDITQIPQWAIEQAKASLHIGYGHTSHGSQLTTGMSGLVGFANSGGLGLSLPTDIFAWNNGGTGGALDLEEGDGYGDGWLDHDCGYYPNWVNETREYLDDPSHSDVNVIIWSWCGQVASRTDQSMIYTYLTPMSQLEADYPDVKFVYMTGHADGSGDTGNVHLRNQQIRDYCEANNKILYDFYDIECYDPDGNYFGDKLVDDDCDYDSNGNGSQDANWAIEWQNSHTEGVDWYTCSSAHSQPLNANRKAYAAWWLWARLGGWNPNGGNLDTDGDGIYDVNDNCLNEFNPGQEDSDQDGIGDACEEVDLICISRKVKKAGILCKVLMRYYSKEINDQKDKFDIVACIDKAMEKFESSWEKAELMAAKKEGDCSTAAVTAIEDIIVISLEDTYNQIDVGLHVLGDKDAGKLGQGLLKTSGKLARDLLKAESANIKKPNPDKRTKSRDRAYAKFIKSWEKAENKADKKHVEYTGPSWSEVQALIDVMVSDVLDGME